MRPLLPLLLLTAAACASGGAPGGDAASAAPVAGGAADGVTWLVQLSDLHLSAHAWPERERDLSLFAARVLRRVRPAALLLSGDLTDSKTADLLGSAQYDAEWASYRRVVEALSVAAGLPEALLLDVRGNHDTFDVPSRGGAGDAFAAHGAAGRRNATRRAEAAHVGGAGGPSVALLALDASRNPGLRRPANFAGAVTPDLRREAAAALAAAGDADALLAFGHFPLSFMEEQPAANAADVTSLGGALAAARAVAYLCGHLHWRFGSRLHAWHAFAATSAAPAPLLELEAGDWKESRAWRLLAFDAAAPAGPAGGTALSFRDFVFDPAAPGPPIVLITSPPDSRYAQPPPAGARVRVKALVFPPKGVPPSALRVRALALCGDAEMAAVTMQPGGDGAGPVWLGPAPPDGGRFAGSQFPLEAFARRCAHPDGLRLVVTVASDAHRSAAGADARPVAFPAATGGPAPMGTTALERFCLGVNGPLFVRAVFWTAFVLHAAAFVLAPRLAAAAAAATEPEAVAAAASWPRAALRCVSAPLRAARAAAAALGARRGLCRCHAAYLAYLALCPWFAADAFSDTQLPAALFYATGVAAAGTAGGARRYYPGMDAVFVTGPQILFVTSGWAAAVACVLAAADAAPPGRDGSRGGARAVARWAGCRPVAGALLVAGLSGLGALTAAALHELRESYGATALMVSPGVAWVPPLAAAALACGLSVPPPSPRKLASKH